MLHGNYLLTFRRSMSPSSSASNSPRKVSSGSVCRRNSFLYSLALRIFRRR